MDTDPLPEAVSGNVNHFTPIRVLLRFHTDPVDAGMFLW